MPKARTTRTINITLRKQHQKAIHKFLSRRWHLIGKKLSHLRHRMAFFLGPHRPNIVHSVRSPVPISYRIHRNHRQPNKSFFLFSLALLFSLIVHVGAETSLSPFSAALHTSAAAGYNSIWIRSLSVSYLMITHFSQKGFRRYVGYVNNFWSCLQVNFFQRPQTKMPEPR